MTVRMLAMANPAVVTEAGDVTVIQVQLWVPHSVGMPPATVEVECASNNSAEVLLSQAASSVPVFSLASAQQSLSSYITQPPPPDSADAVRLQFSVGAGWMTVSPQLQNVTVVGVPDANNSDGTVAVLITCSVVYVDVSSGAGGNTASGRGFDGSQWMGASQSLPVWNMYVLYRCNFPCRHVRLALLLP
jgi:hypothetical protein